VSKPGNPPISLKLLDTDIRDALRLVAEQGGVNLVMSNEVSGSITLDLVDVSLQQALDGIVSVGGFDYSIHDNVVTVSTLTELLEQARQREEFVASNQGASAPRRDVLVLKLRYVDGERMMSVIEPLLAEGGTVTMLKTADHIAKSNGSPQGGGAPGGAEMGLQIGTQLSTSTQGQPAKSHTLVVVDLPERLETIESVVESIDVRPMQVVIEARFVEVSLDDTSKLGIDWNVLAGASGAGAPHTFPFGQSSLGSYDPSVVGGAPMGVFPGAPASVTTPTTAGLFTFGTLDLTAFTAVLQMIRTDARVQVVSNPRIVVGDRHTATILVGERYPILSANVSEFGSVTEQLDRYEPIGVQLEVTPSVLGDDEIELFVRPSTSSLGPLVTGSTGISVARINSRQIDTAVTVRDKQTIVLGGLFTTRDSKETKRVPYLGSIPIVGKLFRHTSKAVVRVDLVVFLTVGIEQEHSLTSKQREMFESSAAGANASFEELGDQSQLEYVSSAARD
jgi:type IV pilus assembly protein PilQ